MQLIITITLEDYQVEGVTEARAAGWPESEVIDMLLEDYGKIEGATFELKDINDAR